MLAITVVIRYHVLYLPIFGRVVCMPAEPVPADPGWDDDPAWTRPDPVPAQDREAWLDHMVAQEDPCALEEYPDPEDCVPLPGEDHLTPQELAEIREAARDLAA